ncbi:MAG TPA: two-component regulator propeller domain-containing protein, partial [Candidatus Kapabacteria bacterium]|nr:two-component regulator propeller domain-containing protein [Candidatus Kapabacteria bacterium]
LLCFIVDKDGMLWCSTVDNGVIVLDPARQNLLVRHMNVQDGLPDISLRALFQDNKGNIWFGGYAQGLALLPYGERFTGKAHSPVPPGALLDNGVRAIVQDTPGHIWIGLRYGGLAEIQNDSIHSYSVKDGLISNGVWAIAFDSVGRMMIGTQLGLGYCDLHNSMYFTRNADFTGPLVFSCGMMGNDYAWFIGGEGLTLYKEKIKLSDTIAPAVYITHFQMNGKDVTPASDMRFAYDQNNFVIDYVGVDLKDARAIRYEYRMLNADEQWRSPTSMREVTYAALAPGTYRFEVRAINANGVKSLQPAIIGFTIVPPFWQRWWFIIATVIAVVVVAILVIRGRVRRLLEIERIRSRIATDLHDDIGSGLTRIAIFSDVASRQISALNAAGGNDDPFVAATSIKKVGNIARELVDAMGDVVWSIDPKQDSMHELISRIRIFAFELCEAKNISLSFEIGKGVEQVKLSSEIKRGILLLVKEALTNVVRHSGCTTVRIEAKLHGQSLNIHVIDNGKGFDASVASFGNGLTNMRKRVEKIGGRFVIASSPDSGTDVDVIIPVTEKTAHLFS